MSFLSNLSLRHAVKSFDPSRPASAEAVAAIQEAIRMAPTSYGLQPFHVTIVSDPELKAKLLPLAYGQTQIVNASHLFVFSAMSDVRARLDIFIDMLSEGDAAKKEALMSGYGKMMKDSVLALTPAGTTEWTARQAYIAFGFALAAAAELNVDTCPMEGFDNMGFKAALGLADTLTPMALIAVGTKSAEEAIRPKIRFGNEDLFDAR